MITFTVVKKFGYTQTQKATNIVLRDYIYGYFKTYFNFGSKKIIKFYGRG